MVLYKRKAHKEELPSLTVEDDGTSESNEKSNSIDLADGLEEEIINTGIEGSLKTATIEPIEDTDKRNDGDLMDDLENNSEETEDEVLEPDIAELPKEVRDTVPMEDDPTIPVFTFRYVILSIIFVCPGAFISTMNSYRTTSAAYSILFVQICSHWLGKWLAKFLPHKRVNFPFTKYGFDLNPGPWSIKETVLVTITAGSGATGSIATNTFALGEVFLDTPVHPAAAIFFMWSIVWIGYSYAALARNFLIYDPVFTWPQALMQTALFQSFKKFDDDSKKGKKQMHVFFYALIGMTIWQFFPEYIFPFTSSLAFLCWVAPHKPTANFLSSGMKGMGFLNLSLDWSNITSSIMITPYWVQVIEFIAFVFACWVLIPAAKYTNFFGFQYGVMDNNILLANGETYPVANLLTPQNTFNQSAYEYYGPLYIGPQRAWNTFFDYASYTSGVVWAFLFGFQGLKDTLIKAIKYRKMRRKQKKLGLKYSSIHDQYTDRLNKLQSHYEDVPDWWFTALFLVAFVILMGLTASDILPLEWWTVIIALGIGAVIVVPLAWLYAFSNFLLEIGTVNELINGIIINLTNSPRHGMTSSLYSCVAGDTWYRSNVFLVDQKLGFYNGISPKLIFASQLFGIMISIPINYGCMRYVVNYKEGYLNGLIPDPLHRWTGQALNSLLIDAVLYVLLGPRRLFNEYPVLPWGFLVGLIAPIVFYVLHRLFPNSRLQFRLWNTTVFFSKMATFYGNISTGYVSKFIGGTVTMYWAFRYKHNLWKDYNYIVAAALDTGFNLTVLLVFIFFNTSSREILMPNWWGNNEDDIQRCFALPQESSEGRFYDPDSYLDGS